MTEQMEPWSKDAKSAPRLWHNLGSQPQLFTILHYSIQQRKARGGWDEHACLVLALPR